MKTKLFRTERIVAAAMLLALASTAFAQETGGAGRGLNGQSYFSVVYLYSNLRDGPPDYYQGIGFRYNQALQQKLDLILTGGLTQSQRVSGARGKQRDFAAGLRWHTDLGQMRPFAEATLGGAWFSYGSYKNNSWSYAGAVGAEFQATPELSFAPLIGYSDAPDFSGAGGGFGVLRTNYWVNRNWSVRVNLSFDDDGWGLGAGFAYGS